MFQITALWIVRFGREVPTFRGEDAASIFRAQTFYTCTLRWGGGTRRSIWLRGKEGRGFDSRWCHLNSLSTQAFCLHYGPGVDTVSKRMCNRNISWAAKAAGALGCQPYHLNVLTVWICERLNLLELSEPVMEFQEKTTRCT